MLAEREQLEYFTAVESALLESLFVMGTVDQQMDPLVLLVELLMINLSVGTENAFD